MKVRKQIPICFPDKSIKGYQESELAQSETNDCMVRATAAAFDVHYDKAHAFCAQHFYRKFRKGSFGVYYKLKEMEADGSKIFKKKIKSIMPCTYYKVYGKEIQRSMTVGTFAVRYPKGTYLLLVKGHAFTIKDGEVAGGNYDDGYRLRRRVEFAWKVA